MKNEKAVSENNNENNNIDIEENKPVKKLRSPPRSLEKEIIKGVKNQENQSQEEKDKIINLPTSNKLVLEALHQNEDGDAYLFIKLVKDRYIYDHITKSWYYWNDHYWKKDRLNHVRTLIKEIIDLYGDQEIFEKLSLDQAEKDGDEKKISQHKYNKKLLNYRIQDLRTLNRKEKILKLSCDGLQSLGMTGEFWDMHDMLLSCKNGCIDLDYGVFNPGNPINYIKTISPVKWEGHDVECPEWDRFLSQMFNNDIEVVRYIQRLFGYGITGLNTEHIFPIFWGHNGRNGKSTLLEILNYILGDLAYKIPNSYLMQTRQKNSDGPDAVTAGLRGRRIVWGSETNENDRIDVAKLKELVGGDMITTRIPYAKETIQFTPSYLLLTITNRCPKVPANDQALWKRIHLIPLINSFVEVPDSKNPYEFKADKNLLKKLKKEAPGILAWLVEGCLIWQLDGLSPPESINSATKQYREKEDVVGDFIKECCILADNELLRIEPKIIYNKYKDWCEEVGHHKMAKKRFLEDLRNRFKTKKTHGTNYFIKIGLGD